ncbi:MAG: fasciclin domain-containing protein [Acidimicrobiia bacterium]
MKKITTLAMVVAMALTMALPAAAAAPSAKPPAATIVDIVLADDGEFDVLQAAVIEADLVELLNGKKKLRVFAPTDAAFVSTFEGILGGPLSEQDVISFIEAGGVDAAFGDGALVDILSYHVTKGDRAPVLARPFYRTFNGDRVTRHQLIEAGVSSTNILASNGVINVLETAVLIP